MLMRDLAERTRPPNMRHFANTFHGIWVDRKYKRSRPPTPCSRRPWPDARVWRKDNGGLVMIHDRPPCNCGQIMNCLGPRYNPRVTFTLLLRSQRSNRFSKNAGGDKHALPDHSGNV